MGVSLVLRLEKHGNTPVYNHCGLQLFQTGTQRFPCLNGHSKIYHTPPTPISANEPSRRWHNSTGNNLENVFADAYKSVNYYPKRKCLVLQTLAKSATHTERPNSIALFLLKRSAYCRLEMLDEVWKVVDMLHRYKLPATMLAFATASVQYEASRQRAIRTRLQEKL